MPQMFAPAIAVASGCMANGTPTRAVRLGAAAAWPRAAEGDGLSARARSLVPSFALCMQRCVVARCLLPPPPAGKPGLWLIPSVSSSDLHMSENEPLRVKRTS